MSAHTMQGRSRYVTFIEIKGKIHISISATDREFTVCTIRTNSLLVRGLLIQYLECSECHVVSSYYSGIIQWKAWIQDKFHSCFFK